jgi:hypothetical protein
LPKRLSRRCRSKRRTTKVLMKREKMEEESDWETEEERRM